MRTRRCSKHKVATNKDEIGSIDFENVGVMVFGCPREKFSKSEFDRLQEFMAKGGSILFFSGEGGENSKSKGGGGEVDRME